jgi:hypothetical protein
VEQITGIPIDSHIKLNFAGFREVVDHLGGVTLEVKEAIDDPYFPGPNYSYDRFIIEAGIQQLDGETALKYARSRYVSQGGDLDRARRQQQIVQAIQHKLFSLSPLRQASLIPGLVGIILDNAVSSLSLNDFLDFYSIYRNTQDYRVSSLVVGQDLLRGPLKENYRMFGRSRGFVLEPRAGAQNYLQIQEEINHIAKRETYLQQIRKVSQDRARVGVIIDGEVTSEVNNELALFRTHGMVVEVIESRTKGSYTGNALYISNPTRAQQIRATHSYLKDRLQTIELDGNPLRISQSHLDTNYDILLYIES